MASRNRPDCAVCVSERQEGRRSFREVQKSKWTLVYPTRRVHVCEDHKKAVEDRVKELVAEKGSAT